MRATQFERHTPATRAGVLSLGDPDSFDARPAGPAVVPRGVVPDLWDALHDFMGAVTRRAPRARKWPVGEERR
ncbi:MAG TPA: hypothetical protein VKF14_07335 [Candidatus Dormibacteraeota bacterium]|nr:hypothetical protein [Candidatus Dormibacteraeota bacterium]